MLRRLSFLIFLASYALCANHTIFKDCSRITFCSKFRDAKPTSLLTAQTDKSSTTNNVVYIPISNDKQEFNLQISILTNQTARIKILEKESTRYELKDVLKKEPTPLEPTIDISKAGEATIKATDEKYSHKVVVTDDPLKIEFYFDDSTLQSVLKGDNLIFDNETQSFAFGVEFVNAIRLYGLHHHAVDLELPDTKATNIDPFRLRNSDIPNYEVGSPMAMYGAVPAVYAHSANSTTGVFLHNAAEQWIDTILDKSSVSVYFMVEQAALDLFVFLGNTPKEIVRQFVEITGVAHMPQLWTLGYHQCRWSYFTQEDAQGVVAQMDAHDLPMDAIWLDIDYTDSYKYFTWNPTNYSDPIEFQKNISSTNRKLVVILDPHIKKEAEYPVYSGAKDKYFVKWENGSDFEGNCWPGLSSYIDFLNPEARDYYASWYHYENFVDSTPTLAGVWNDMNEPSVFDEKYENTMPFELLHYGNVTHGDIHNIYGFLQTMATHQGLMERDNGTKRPFILTRSTFAGSQRYAIMWTGDNTADWPYMRVSYSECLMSNLVGLVFCGADVGGFFYNPEAELVERWYQAGVWLPFYRGHAELNTERREPYLYNSTVQEVIRNALRTRYRHIPVWYTLFYEHTRNGDPVIRPLFYDYPGLVDKDDHILLGSDILARPVMSKGDKSVDVTFPGTKVTYWYRVDKDFTEIYTGGDQKTLPVDITTSPYFYRGGSIIATKDEARKSTTDMIDDPYSLYVNLDNNNEASGNLYVDDFTSFDYQNKGLYIYLKISYITSTGGIIIKQIDGVGTNFTVNVNHIYIHQKSTTDENKYTRTVVTNLADGTPLKDVKLIPKLVKDKVIELLL